MSTLKDSTALDAVQMEERLDVLLESALSSRRMADRLAQQLATCSRTQQEYVLHWVDIIRRSNGEIAFQFADYAKQALKLMDEDGIEAWVIHAMDVYDKTGLKAAIDVVRGVEQYAKHLLRKTRGVPLEEVHGVLETFISGLSGRRLKLAVDEQVFTDTDTLFLPEVLGHFEKREDNFFLYKVTAVHLWAQTRFGTWQVALHEVVRRFPDPDRACRLFHTLERLRLEAQIAQALPGLFRDMCSLLERLNEQRVPTGWEAIEEHITRPDSHVGTSLELLSQIYEQDLLLSDCAYQGVLLPDRVEEVRAIRLAKEKDLFRLGLVKTAEEHDQQQPQEAAEAKEPIDPLTRFSIEQIEEEQQGMSFELQLDGMPIVPPDNVKSLMDSIIQDTGLIPEEYLTPAGAGHYVLAAMQWQQEKDPSEVWQGIYHEDGAFIYPEWDHNRQHYRKNWCVMREVDVQPSSESFVRDTLYKYRGLVKNLRRTFEGLRGEQKLLRAQPFGEDIDLDAFVQAYADAHSGLEMTNRLFTKLERHERNIAVMFMVDMSGSTKGWINDAERESLILLCEALDSLDDRYAIYGFSGFGRKRCELYRVKHFDEPYNSLVKQRISGIKPQDYTRMGVAIRHLSGVLKEQEARIKLLITLSDGQPDDYGDNYRGEYGIEDTRQALFEAKREGIHTFCITLDTEAKDYLRHMYGHVNYIVIDEVRKLPLKVSDIYRRLTT